MNQLKVGRKYFYDLLIPDRENLFRINNPFVRVAETKEKVRVYLSPKHWQDVNGMREPGESFDDVVGRMIEDQKIKKILSEMDEMIEHGEFVDLKDVPEYQRAVTGPLNGSED